MFIIDDRYKNYGLEYTMSYTLTQYQTTPGISRDYVSTFELGSFSANSTTYTVHVHYATISICTLHVMHAYILLLVYTQYMHPFLTSHTLATISLRL